MNSGLLTSVLSRIIIIQLPIWCLYKEFSVIGIIPRSRADRLLQKKPSGSFLVRVSERIWGYTLSYVVGDGNIKHFLIEKIPQGYQFLGINQVVHQRLHELIAFHEVILNFLQIKLSKKIPNGLYPWCIFCFIFPIFQG